MNTQSLWLTIKQTLLEKSDSGTLTGSIKRWAAWILLFLVSLTVIQGLIPGGSIHLGTFLNFAWNHQPSDMKVLTALLTATGTYVLTGQAISNITDTIQNYHNTKYPNDNKGDNKPVS